MPFQVVETVNESRATREAEQGSLYDDLKRSLKVGWRNRLIWGDNKLVLASLREEFAGMVKLVYIDPPFATGADFSHHVSVGDVGWVKQASILEEHAYRDTWGRGYDSYLTMLYERLVLLKDLVAPDGSIYVHLDWRAVHYVKPILDEIFGGKNFKNEIIWRRANTHNDPDGYGRVHDTLLYYRLPDGTFNRIFGEYREEYLAQVYRHVDPGGRRYQTLPLHATHVFSNKDDNTRRFGDKVLRPPAGKYWRWSQKKIDEAWDQGMIVMSKNDVPRYKKYLDEAEGVPVQSIWDDLKMLSRSEMLGYPTQKPESLLERIIKSSSNEGDLVLDCFAGSGTTAAVAEKFGRRWIACDIGRFAIHTTRKRLLNTPGCAPFEVLNLGFYERQHWQKVAAENGMRDYVHFLVDLYEAEPITGYRHLHGKKAARLVHVGAVDAPVTITEVEQAMDELSDNDLGAADILGWEWEMGLHEVIEEEARRRGLSIACRQIPREVMEANSGATIRFFELAYLEFQIDRDRRKVRVQLRDFVIPSDELIPESVRLKITQWSDYIDYWSVDFNFRDDTFHNEWQVYRTREEPSLAIESDWHEYEEPARYAIVVKVIDIFGNDTTKLAEVNIR